MTGIINGATSDVSIFRCTAFTSAWYDGYASEDSMRIHMGNKVRLVSLSLFLSVHSLRTFSSPAHP
jgi:hypothetical protein